MDQVRRAFLADMFVEAEVVAPSLTVSLPAVLVHTNAPAIGLADFARAGVQRTYRPQVVTYEPVRLGRLPPRCILYGSRSFWLEADGMLAIEQINPLSSEIPQVLAALQAMPCPTHDIVGPCLLVARYGDVTWGHWLCELLPRAVVAESLHPGRFRYVVPAGITEPTRERSFSTAVLELLAFYGIGPDRLLRLDSDAHYRFRQLYAVSGVWSPEGINPAVIHLVRSAAVGQADPAPARRIALMRGSGATRQIHNIAEVTACLREHGFDPVSPAALPFADQVAQFRSATAIFGVLGSDFSGLMYAPDGVGIIGAAPGAWHDAYFYNVMQLRDAVFVDLRGPPLWTGEGLERDAPFLLPLPHLAAGLAAARAAPAGDRITVAGATIPRRLGEPVLEVDFGAGGTSALHRGRGWSAQEEKHVWSDGPVSTLTLPRPAHDGDLWMELRVLAFAFPPHLVSRQLDVEVNGLPVASFAIAGWETLFCPIPASCLAGHDRLDVVFRHPFCVPMAMCGQGPDQRAVSAAFFNLTLRRA